MLVSIPLKKRLFVLEWKCIQIDYIDVGSGSPLEKANFLADIRDVSTVLDLRFRNDKFRPGQTVRLSRSGLRMDLRTHSATTYRAKRSKSGKMTAILSRQLLPS